MKLGSTQKDRSDSQRCHTAKNIANTLLDADQGSQVRVNTARDQKRLWRELNTFMDVQRTEGLSAIESVSLLVFNNMAAPSLVSSEHQQNQAAILGAGIDVSNTARGFTVCRVWQVPGCRPHVTRAQDHRDQQCFARCKCVHFVREEDGCA